MVEPTYATAYECPIIDCDWLHVEQPMQAYDRTLATVFGAGTIAATSAFTRAHEVERTIREHLTSHTVEEWTDTCARLRAGHVDLLPHEQMALAVASSQLARGDPASANVAATCVAALQRLTGQETSDGS